MNKNGVRWEKPVLTIDTLGTPAIPHLRINHQNNVNLENASPRILFGCDNDLKKDTKTGIGIVFFWRFFIFFF